MASRSAAEATRATSRVESQARTRQLVLDAAERLFLANGFGATSLEDIAREAGFSKGAVYSNFAGKTDLFFAIVEDQFFDLSAQLRDAVAAADPDPASQLAAVGTWYQQFLTVEAGWSRSLPELAAIAAQDDQARARFTALLQSIEGAITDLLSDQQRALGIRFGLPPASIAALVVSLVVGLTVRSLHDMDSPPELFDAALARLLTF
jgi:AcrR family transcriptional regulator